MSWVCRNIYDRGFTRKLDYILLPKKFQWNLVFKWKFYYLKIVFNVGMFLKISHVFLINGVYIGQNIPLWFLTYLYISIINKTAK